MSARPTASGKSGMFAFLAVLTFAAPGAQSAAAQIHATDRPSIPASVVDGYGALPLAFELNRGQADPAVRYVAHGEGYSLALTDSEAILALRGPVACPQARFGLRSSAQPCVASHDILHLKLAGARTIKAAKIAADVALPGKVNYFIGNDPAKWHTGVPIWEKVRYADVYPGIDLVYYGNQRQLEYDFVVAPRADAGRIRLRLQGAQKLSLDLNGSLIVKTTGGVVTLDKPVIYQNVSGSRHSVSGGFALLSSNTIGFQPGKYDHDKPLIIDPVLIYGTYLGGASNDGANAIAVDTKGNVYLTGYTSSANFLTVDGFQSKDPNSKAQVSFVTKLSPYGSNLLYSTYLGGTTSNGDSGNGIAIDSTGAAYVVGTTFANDFPTQNPIQKTNKAYSPKNGGSNVFVTKLAPSGSELAFSTYLGGSASDSGSAIALDSALNVYLTGSANSRDFPLVKPVQAQNNSAGNGTNAFLAKIDSSGGSIAYSTYLGGSGNFYLNGQGDDGYPSIAGDFGVGVAVDSLGEAVVSGTTYSLDFPVSHAFQSQNNAQILVGPGTVSGNDANSFVTKYNADGSGYIFSTYLGGSGFSWQCGTQNGGLGDTGGPVAVDASGNIYVTGGTRSSDFPTTHTITISGFSGAAIGNGGGPVSDTNAFVTAFKPDGSGLLFSTFLGGTAPDECSADDWSNGTCGYAAPCEPGLGGYGTAVEYDGDYGNGIAVGPNGVIYVTGSTGSFNFPLKNAFQAVNRAEPAGSQTAFLTAINPAAKAPLLYSTYYGGNSHDSASGVAVGAHGDAYIAGQTSSPDLPVSYDAFHARLHGPSDAFVARFALKDLNIAPVVEWTPPAAITYGDALGPKELNARANVNGRFVYSPKAGTVLGVGEHTLSVTFEPYYASVYAVATKTVKITVKKATLTVTAENQTMKQGQPVPPLTYKITGFVKGDTQKTATSGKPSLKTTATSKSAPGEYVITITDGNTNTKLTAKNYGFRFVNGTLTISK